MKIKRMMAWVCILTLLCTGCTMSRRFGMQELSRRLSEYDERFAFSLEGVSLSNEFYHIAFSFQQEEDLLLSCKEDADGQLLQILLTAEKNSIPTAEFLAFSQALVGVFFGISEFRATQVLHEAGLTDESVLFTDYTGAASQGRYSFTFFSTPLSVTAMLAYDDAIVAGSE